MDTRKKVKLALKLALGICFLVTLILAIQKLFSNDTIISMHYDTDFIPLPALTICPSHLHKSYTQKVTGEGNQTLVDIYNSSEPLDAGSILEAFFVELSSTRDLETMR